MLDLPSIELVYDLSLKTYDYLDRRYDLLGTRAATLMGFTSLLIPGAATVVSRLQKYPNLRWFMIAVFLGGIAKLVYHGVHAYRARNVKSLPDPASLYRSMPQRQSRSSV